MRRATPWLALLVAACGGMSAALVCDSLSWFIGTGFCAAFAFNRYASARRPDVGTRARTLRAIGDGRIRKLRGAAMEAVLVLTAALALATAVAASKTARRADVDECRERLTACEARRASMERLLSDQGCVTPGDLDGGQP